MAVNDLFLGGVDEKVKLAKGAPAPLNLNVEKSISPDALASDKASPDNSTADASTSEKSTISDSDAKEKISTNATDVTIETLLQRIQDLEKRVGTNANKETNQSTEDQRHLPHNVQYQIDRIKQSPVQNRRDDFLAAKWRNQEEETKQAEENSSGNYGLQTIVETAKRWLHMGNNSTVEWMNEKISELASKVRIIIGNYGNEKLNSQDIPDRETPKASDNPVVASNALGDEKIALEEPPTDETVYAVPADSTKIPNESSAPANEKTEGRLNRWWSNLSWRRKKNTDDVDRPSRESDESKK